MIISQDYIQLKLLYEKAIRKELNVEVIKNIYYLQDKVRITLYSFTEAEKKDFFSQRRLAEREVSYWINANIGIELFLIDQGFKENGSTKQWRRFSQDGDNKPILLTNSNTVYYLKTGISQNLFAFIIDNYPKINNKISDTAHFINTVIQKEGLTLHQVQIQNNLYKISHKKTDKASFDLSNYRIQSLKTNENYLIKRGISNQTLNSSLFKNTIFQGNKADNLKFNNIIYPFKAHPTYSIQQTLCLLQQYNRKIEISGKLVDKVFSAGIGKSLGLWFSNIPEKISELRVFENPLDALSHYELYQPQNTLYCATGGRPGIGQLKLIEALSKEYELIPTLSFDRDIAGILFDIMYISIIEPNRIQITGVNNNLVINLKLDSDAVSRLIYNISKVNCDFEYTKDGIKILISNNIQAEICRDYLLTCSQVAFIDKSVRKDFNEDLMAQNDL